MMNRNLTSKQREALAETERLLREPLAPSIMDNPLFPLVMELIDRLRAQANAPIDVETVDPSSVAIDDPRLASLTDDQFERLIERGLEQASAEGQIRSDRDPITEENIWFPARVH